MTGECTAKKAATISKGKAENTITILIFIAASVALIFSHDIIKKSVMNSVKMCISTILPSIFPFMILSDYLLGNIDRTDSSKLGGIFSKCFNISSAAIWPFIIGNVCGFPLGAKTSIGLYNRGAITKTECERLIGFANNPSLAFIISGVGIGMRHSLHDGVILYLTVIISSCIIGIITKGKTRQYLNSNEIFEQNYSFVNSIKNSIFAVISVSSYIIFFSMIADVIISHINLQPLSLFLTSMLEIGTATNLISKSSIPKFLGLPLTAFALGFSGLSVYLQTLSFAPDDIKKFKCFIMKLLQGVIAFIIALIYSIIVM